MTPDQIIRRLKELRVPHERIAQALGGLNRVQATKMLAGRRMMKAHETEPLARLVEEYEQKVDGPGSDVRSLIAVNITSYVPVDILPTYAGAGGGGTGEGEVEQALVPRYLVEDVFHGGPKDFVVVRIRGDSMEPDFHQDDELLVDRRDVSPTQPGPFVIWDGEWSEYVVKNVERLPGGRLRIFSSNPKYTPIEVTHDMTRILGRPVWFGRRL